MYRSQEYAAWRKHAEWAVAGQVKGKRILGEYTLEIVAVKPDKRRRDLGNLEKAISDILQHVKVIEDDYLCQDIRIRWAKTGPECEIIVREYEDGTEPRSVEKALYGNGTSGTPPARTRRSTKKT